MSEQIDTKQVTERRSLRFDSIDDCLAEIDRIVAAAQQGDLKALGNWTPGQVMAHLAAWIEYGYDGYPLKAPPFFVRWILRMQLKKMLNKGMPSGVRIPGIKEGTIGMDPMETGEAAERLRAAFARLQNRDEAKFDSPAFGKMSHDDRVLLNLRHAELHLSFLDY